MNHYAKAWSVTNLLTRQGRSFSGHERNSCFLNTGAQRFADVSTTMGLNLAEDGRSWATVDWDHDGDLDLWLTNRTAPRVRFFRNDYPRTHHFVSFRLRGSTCNRDAIGARLELHVDGASPDKTIRTLRAGDGFLGQSSKSIHFGLGNNDKITRLIVRWPGSAAEEFRDVQVDQHHVIVQGTGVVQVCSARDPLELSSASIDVPLSSEKARIVLVGRVPFPDAQYRRPDGTLSSVNSEGHGPVLVQLWASWCRPCLDELQEITSQAERLRRQRLQIVALSVDDLDNESASNESANNESPSDAWQRILHRLRFPFSSGLATSELVTALDLLQRTILDRKRPLPVPSSFLIDRHGQIAVIYKGPVGVDRLLHDLTFLDADPTRLRDLAVPLPGRWFTPPATSDPMQIAGAMLDHGLPDLAERYCQQLVDYFSLGAGGRLIRSADRSRKLAELHAFHGSLLLSQNKLAEAEEALRLAVQADPQDRKSNVGLGQALTKLGKTSKAVQYFEAALKLEPNDADTHYNLAIGLTVLGRHRQAIAHYGDVLLLRPGWPPAANNLAWILATHPDPSIRDGQRAVQLSREVCQQVNYQDATGLDTLAAAQAESGQLEAAVLTIQRAIRLAESRHDERMLSKLRERLKTYEMNQPFRDLTLTF